jgi:hypothetical protein
LVIVIACLGDRDRQPWSRGLPELPFATRSAGDRARLAERSGSSRLEDATTVTSFRDRRPSVIRE